MSLFITAAPHVPAAAVIPALTFTPPPPLYRRPICKRHKLVGTITNHPPTHAHPTPDPPPRSSHHVFITTPTVSPIHHPAPVQPSRPHHSSTPITHAVHPRMPPASSTIDHFPNPPPITYRPLSRTPVLPASLFPGVRLIRGRERLCPADLPSSILPNDGLCFS